MADSSKVEEAKKWVDSLQDRWRLQVLSKRFRIDKTTGEQVDMPVRIRRFVEGVPWALVEESVKYLLSKAPYTGIVYNGVEVGGSYRPTMTTWKRDDNDEVNSKTSIKRNDGTYTLIQDLVDERHSDSYDAVTQVSCSEEVLTTWHWDEANIESLPSGGEQGVTYAVASAGRNEDGTFNYSLVKRVAKTQHSAKHVQTDDAVSKVEVETWDNVYGAFGEYTDELGNDLSIPTPSGESGTKCEVQTSENDDCTFRISATWTATKEAVAKESCEKDQFKHGHSTTTFGQAAALGEAPEPAGGVVTKHDTQLNPDGTHTNTVSTETERPVGGATVEIHVGRRGTRRTVVDTNQDTPASTTSVGLGGAVKVEKTPGKLFNNTVTSWVTSALAKVADVCKIDVFRHQHSNTEAGLSELPIGDVDGSGVGGVVKTRTTQMDDDGAITRTLETETEKPVEKSRESWIYGLFGRRHRTENQHQAAPLAAPAASGSLVGTTIVNEKTPGGLYNTTVEEIDRTAGSVNAGAGCAKTVFEHEDKTVVRDPSGALPPCVEAAGGGVHRQRTSTLNDDGSSTVQDVTTTEVKVEQADVEYRRTAKAVFERVTDRNTTAAAGKPTNAGETEAHTTNPGGTRNVTKTKIEITGGTDHGRCRQDIFSHEHDETKVTKGITADTSDTPAPGGGKTYSKESSVDDLGLVTTVTRTTTENEVKDANVSYERKVRGLVTTKTVKSGSVAASDPGDGKVGSVSGHVKTPGGLYDLTTRSLTPSAKPDSARCTKTVFEHVHDTVTMSEGAVDTSDAPVAGGGHYYEKTSELDGDGFVKTVVRDHNELPSVPSGASAYVDAHYSSSSTTTQGESSGVPVATHSPGRIESVRTTRHPGGTWEVTKEVQTAKIGQTWSAESSSNNVVRIATVGFFNLQASSFSTVVGNLINKGASWAQGTVNGVCSEGLRFSCSSTMNKFGYLDGSATVVVQWPSTAFMNTVLCSIRYMEKHRNVKPMYRTGTNSSGQAVVKVVNQIATISRECEFCAGFGRSTVEGKFSGTVYPGTHAIFHPNSGAWSGTIIKGETEEITYDTSNMKEVLL